jgi:hypothetical protein
MSRYAQRRIAPVASRAFSTSAPSRRSSIAAASHLGGGGELLDKHHAWHARLDTLLWRRALLATRLTTCPACSASTDMRDAIVWRTRQRGASCARACAARVRRARVCRACVPRVCRACVPRVCAARVPRVCAAPRCQPAHTPVARVDAALCTLCVCVPLYVLRVCRLRRVRACAARAAAPTGSHRRPPPVHAGNHRRW